MNKNKIIIYLMIFTALLLAALPLAGCTGSGSTTATTAAETTMASMTAETAAAGTTTATTANTGGQAVTIESNSFNPASLTIKVGETVTWTNKDSYAHTVTSDNGAFDSGNIASGSTFSFTFDTAGTYSYHCSIHTSMTAKIIVQ
jgi:plastocyanin